MPPPAPARLLPVLTFLAVQAALWLVLALAFAALLVIAGSLTWTEAFGLSALNWLPWALLAPIVFWLSLRRPLLPGHLWRHIPVHLAACAACVALMFGLARELGPFGGPLPGGGPPELRNRPMPDKFSGRPEPKSGPSRHGDFGPPEERGRHEGPPDWAPRGRPVEFERGGPPERGPFGGRMPPLGSILLRANFDLAVYLIVAAAAHALMFYRRAQERDRQALALTAGLNRAKLEALRLQLQPHFLFNTLNAISTLVHRDANAADELIGNLADLLRLSLLTTEHEVPLARELELLDRYLAIEQARLGDRLRVVHEIDPAVTGALVPTFVLQPLAENAIRHGIEPRSAPGTITISAARDGDKLRLVVADDGIGLASDNHTSRRGIGLGNTEARLQALHATAAKLELRVAPAGGLRVEITLPFHAPPAPQA